TRSTEWGLSRRLVVIAHPSPAQRSYCTFAIENVSKLHPTLELAAFTKCMSRETTLHRETWPRVAIYQLPAPKGSVGADRGWVHRCGFEIAQLSLANDRYRGTEK